MSQADENARAAEIEACMDRLMAKKRGWAKTRACSCAQAKADRAEIERLRADVARLEDVCRLEPAYCAVCRADTPSERSAARPTNTKCAVCATQRREQ